jgi:ribosome-associated protein
MDETAIILKDFSKEFSFSASRSSGPGGQHVNKVNTKVELRFNIPESKILNKYEKLMLQHKLKSSLTGSGDLIVCSQTERSQIKNKEICTKKFYLLIQNALKPSKTRRATKPTMASKVKRRKKKEIHSEKKQLRKKPII